MPVVFSKQGRVEAETDSQDQVTTPASSAPRQYPQMSWSELKSAWAYYQQNEPRSK